MSCLPCTVSLSSTLVVPALFSATHVYTPASSGLQQTREEYYIIVYDSGLVFVVLHLETLTLVNEGL